MWLPALALFVPVALAAGLWFFPVDGDDAYHHSIFAVEQARCWRAGDLWPAFHPDWNWETGSFFPTIYSPVVLSLDGALLLAAGEATRAVSLSLALALLAAGLVLRSRGPAPPVWALAPVAPYLLLAVLARATVTELWALALMAGALPWLIGRDVGNGVGRALVPLVLAVLAVGAQPIMLILVALPLGAAWAVRWWLEGFRAAVRPAARMMVVMVAAGVFWFPPLAWIGNFDRSSLFSGEFGWRNHFATSLGGNAEIGPVLLAIWVSLFVVFVAAGIHGVSRFRNDPTRVGELVLLGTSLFLASPLSAPLWCLPGLGIVQFPWRFLGPATLSALLVLGRLRGRLRGALGAVFLLPLLLVPVEIDAGVPALTADLDGTELARACSVRYGLAPILPSMPGEYAREFHPLRSLRVFREQPARCVEGGGGGLPRTFVVEVRRRGDVRLPVQWWPGLEVVEDGRPLAYRNLDGLVAVGLDWGRHRLTVSLLPLKARRAGLLFLLAGIVLLQALHRRGVV